MRISLVCLFVVVVVIVWCYIMEPILASEGILTAFRWTSRVVRHCPKDYTSVNKINIMVIRSIEKSNIKRTI